MERIRNITREEYLLIEFLLSEFDSGIWSVPIKTWTMDDGGMGSISFDLDGKFRHKSDLIEAKYIDRDNIPVVITLTVDDNNQLFELDFWKTNFSKLVKCPTPFELEIIRINKTDCNNE